MATTNHRGSLLDKNQFFRRLKERELSGQAAASSQLHCQELPHCRVAHRG